MSKDNQEQQKISTLYAQLDKEQVSKETDEAILNFARQRNASNGKPKSFMNQRYRWLSVAASVTLVSVLFISQWQSFTPDALQEPVSVPLSVSNEATSNNAESEPEKSVSPLTMAESSPEVVNKRSRAQDIADQEKIVVTGSRRLMTQESAVKPECRFSLDGANPISNSTLGKYLQGAERQLQTALVIAINNNIPLSNLLKENAALTEIAEKPGFSEQYDTLSQQVKSCVAQTGPANQ